MVWSREEIDTLRRIPPYVWQDELLRLVEDPLIRGEIAGYMIFIQAMPQGEVYESQKLEIVNPEAKEIICRLRKG